jgi:hypothetical protein
MRVGMQLCYGGCAGVKAICMCSNWYRVKTGQSNSYCFQHVKHTSASDVQRFPLSHTLFTGLQQSAKRENWQLRNSVIFISCKIAVIRDAEHPQVTRNFKVSGSYCVPALEPTEISFMHKLVERVCVCGVWCVCV